MATRIEIKGDRISSLRAVVGFLPVAFGYFLTVLFQKLEPLVADDLTSELAIGAGSIATAAFPLAFALCLLPAGIAIDRFGPRAVQSVMMTVTALGAMIVSMSAGPFGLMAGRALLGAGAASALLAAMKASVAWFARRRLGLLTGGLVTVAGLGALAMAGPLLAQANGGRALFMWLAALAALGAVLAVLLIPASAAPEDRTERYHGLTFILRDPVFRRLAPLAAIAVGAVWAAQGQWLAGWFAAVKGVRLTDIITYITLIAIGQTAGALALGWLADWAVRKGSSATAVFVGCAALGVCIQLAAVLGIGLPASIIWGALVAGAAAVLPFVVLLAHFPRAYAARACASVVVLQSVATFLIQSAFGVVVAVWPPAASGQTSLAAYAMAFMVPVALQLAALAWYFLGRTETRDAAQNDREAAAFARQVRGLSEPSSVLGLPPDAVVAPAEPAESPAEAETIDSAAALAEKEMASAPADIAEAATEPAGFTAEPPDSAANPADSVVETPDAGGKTIDTAPASTDSLDETGGAASALAEAETALNDTPAEPSHAAATPSDPAVEPGDNGLEPIDAASASTETADETDTDNSVSAEPVEGQDDPSPEPASGATKPPGFAAPADADRAPADILGAPAEIDAALANAALQSVLDVPPGLGSRRATDAASRAAAETPAGGARADGARISQPPVQELSFPPIAPSHVQALNAVYRRRPALPATIGGRQMSIAAAWPPDRRPDASHLMALRLDGEPCELWLPQSLLDILVASVDPALSLDRLGPDRAAILLEFALESVLAAVESNLGCKLAVDSYSSQAERRENEHLVPLFFNLGIEGLAATGCELRMSPVDALRLAEGLDRYAGSSAPVLDLPIPVCLRVAAANLAADEIERLSPDDVVLVDAACEPGDAVIAVIGERLVAPVTPTPEGYRLAVHPIPGATSSWAWSLPTEATAGAWEADETDHRSLHVLFEIGRFEMPASQVRQLVPNFALPLESLRDQTVDIVAGGKRIGRGMMMRIGNRTGIRVIAIRERSRRAPVLKGAPAEEGVGFQ